MTQFQNTGPGFQYWDHRGLPSAPEESLDSYRGSVAAGALCVEVDCHMLSDGTVAVMHDSTVDRTTTSSGPVAGYNATTWKQLVMEGGAGINPPLLDEILSEFGGDLPLIIEAKSSGSGAAIVDRLKFYNVAPASVLINSFISDELIAALRDGYPTCINLGTYGGTPTLATLVARGYQWASVNATTTAWMDSLRAAGIKVVVYTLNTPEEVLAVKDHCDAVYSDNAIYLRSLNP